MPDSAEMNALADRMESYLVGHLLPFWQTRAPDREYGGFLSHFGRDGRPTGETVKTYLSHIRLLFVMSIAERYGYCRDRSAELARWGADFLLDH